MGFSTSWYIPERVMLVKLTGQITTEDVKQINQLVLDSHSPDHHMVHQIVDITEMTKPPGFGSLRQHAHTTQPGDGHLVIVGRLNILLEFILNSISQAKNMRISVVDTLDEAIEELMSHDPSLIRFGSKR